MIASTLPTWYSDSSIPLNGRGQTKSFPSSDEETKVKSITCLFSVQWLKTWLSMSCLMQWMLLKIEKWKHNLANNLKTFRMSEVVWYHDAIFCFAMLATKTHIPMYLLMKSPSPIKGTKSRLIILEDYHLFHIKSWRLYL